MAMDVDDDLNPKVLVETPETLQGMSVEELKEYVAELEAGIARAQDVIGDKEKHLSGADALFKN